MATTNKYKSTVSRISDNPDTEVIQYKRPLSIKPWSVGEQTRNGSVWISMKPKKIVDQYSKGSGTFDTIDTNKEFLFLAPKDIGENIVHQWEAYESVASRMAQKARSAVKLGSEATALYNVGKNLLEPGNIESTFRNGKNLDEGSTIENLASKVYGKVLGSKVPNIKIDTPLYYANSQRRELMFTFQLYNEALNTDPNPEKYLLDPIHELMKYSCPELKNENDIFIEFPYMFEVKTHPQPFIKYTTCVLTAVQPTWNAPYVKGIPSSCNLQLTFKDLSPLYASTIEKGSIINVKSGSVDAAIKQDKKSQKQLTSKPIRVFNASRGR